MTRENILSLRDFLFIVFKHKLGIFLVFVLIVFTVTTLTYMWPFTYETSSKILVKFERDSVPLSGSSQTPRPILTMRRMEEEIRSEIEILNNKYLIEKSVRHLWNDLTQIPLEEPTSRWGKTKALFKKTLIQIIHSVYEIGYHLNLIEKLTPFEAEVNKVQRNLKIEAVKDSNIIQVTYRSWYPELCAKMVNTFTDLYLEQHIKAHKIPRAHELFLKQKELLQTALNEKEEELKDFKQKWAISSIDVQKKLLLEDLSTLVLDNKNLLSEIKEIKERIDWLKHAVSQRTNYRQPDTVSPTILNADPIYRDLEQRILVNESQLTGLKAKNNSQEKQIEYYQSKIRSLDGKEIELHRRERELNILEENYKRYVSRLEDTRVSEAMDLERISNVSIVEPAIVPFVPIRKIPFMPRRVLHICVSIIVGLIVGIGYAFLTEYLDHTFHIGEDVEQFLRVPCLASIPQE